MSDIKFDCSWCGQSLEAPEDMGGEVLDCPSCKRRIKVPSAPSKPKLQLRKSPHEASRPATALPTPSYSPPTPPAAREPRRRQVAFVCPHCNINIQGVAYPGETVQCLTCGGAVIVPEGCDVSAASGSGGQGAGVVIGLVILGLFLWWQFSSGGCSSTTSSSGTSPASESSSSGTSSASYQWGYNDARTWHQRNPFDKEDDALAICYRCKQIDEGAVNYDDYSRGFRNKWRQY